MQNVYSSELISRNYVCLNRLGPEKPRPIGLHKFHYSDDFQLKLKLSLKLENLAEIYFDFLDFRKLSTT